MTFYFCKKTGVKSLVTFVILRTIIDIQLANLVANMTMGSLILVIIN